MPLRAPRAEQALDLSSTAVRREQKTPELTHNGRSQFDFELRYVPSPARRPAPAYSYSFLSSQTSPESNWCAWRSSCARSTAAPSPPLSPELYEDSLADDVEYQAFERDALQAMAEKNGGTLLGNNPRMRRAVQAGLATPVPHDVSYWKHRERNNSAAKQSRDRRKLREVRLAFQVTFLKKKLAALRDRLAEKVCARCRRRGRC